MVFFLKKLEEDGLKHILVKDDELFGSYLAEDIINISGEVLFEAGDLIDKELLSSLKELDIKNINILKVDSNTIGPWMLNTIQNDKNLTREEALEILEEIEENVNTCCAITMEPDDVLVLIDKLKNYLENE